MDITIDPPESCERRERGKIARSGCILRDTDVFIAPVLSEQCAETEKIKQKRRMSMDVKKICTCDNTECVNNPCNQDGGCTNCVATNLECNAIPRCFFHKLGFNSDEINTWTFEEFSMKVTEKSLKDKGLA